MLDAMQAKPRPAEALVPFPVGPRPVDPNGWDIVSAVRIGALNAAIRNAGTSPEGFTHRPVPEAEVSARFDPWQIAPDGNGLLINLALPLRDIAVSYRGQTATLAEGTAQVRVELEYLPAEPRRMLGASGEVETVKPYLLVLRTRPNRQGPLMALAGAEKVAQVLTFSGRRELGRLYSAFKVGLEDWLNAHLAAFQHVFATVNVIEAVSQETKGGFDWIKPSAVSYAFGQDRKAPEDSVLAILCRTGGRNADGLIAQAQADMIPPGSNAALCISRQRIAQDMVSPGLVQGFAGLSARDLVLGGKGTIVNVGHDVKLEKVTDPDTGKSYDPVLKSLKVSVGEREIEVRSRTETMITPGAYSIDDTIAGYTLGIPKGRQSLVFAELHADSKHQERQDKEATIWEWVARGLGLVGLAVASFMTAGAAALIVGAISAAILLGAVTREFIKLANSEAGAPIDLLVANASQAVSWSTAETFTPLVAGLNGGLVIGGQVPVGERMRGASDADSPQRAFQAPFAAAMAQRAFQAPFAAAMAQRAGAAGA